MAVRLGKCTNYAACGTAYRNDSVAAESEMFLCPECGRALTARSSSRLFPSPWMSIAVGTAVILLVILLAWCLMKRNSPAPSPAPHARPPQIVAVEPPIAPPVPSPTPIREEPATPAPATPRPTASPAGPSNVPAEVRQEVLKRITLMPSLTADTKKKLLDYAEKAREMSRLFTVQFTPRRPGLSSRESQMIRQQTQNPEFQRLANDPATVFVILGYSDKRGDEKRNLQISLRRAEAVMATLRNKCSVSNVLQVVGMGGSDLFDAGDGEKNQVVEVWGVLP